MTQPSATVPVDSKPTTPSLVTLPKIGGYEPEQPSDIRRGMGAIIVCMGPSGSGKTSLVETLFPKYGPVGVADVDKKAHVLRDRPGELAVYPANSMKRINELNEGIKRSHDPFKTWVWDGLSLMQLLSQVDAGVFTTDNPMVRQSKYGNANNAMISLARDAKTMAERGLNVIFNVWSLETRDSNGAVVNIGPALSDTLQVKMLGIFDFLFYIQHSDPPHTYPPYMRTGGSAKYDTRTAIAPDSPLHDMPDIIYQPSYTSILDTFHGAPWPTELHVKH